MVLVLLRGVCFAALFTGCSLGPSASDKAEAGLIARAIDVLRDAPNAQKGELLDALKAATCTAPDLCELQKQCIDGFGQHVAALNETERAKGLLKSGGSDTEAAQVLDYARKELTEAAPKIAKCADAEGAAKRKYKP